MARKPRKLPPSQRPGHISCYLTMQQFKSAELTGNPRAIIGQLQRLASSLAQNGQIDVKTLLVWADGAVDYSLRSRVVKTLWPSPYGRS